MGGEHRKGFDSAPPRFRTIQARLNGLVEGKNLAVIPGGFESTDETMGAVVNPFARGRDPLAGGNGCGMANHGHDVTMPARLGAQNAKTIFGVVVGYSLDEARQHFLGRRFRLARRFGAALS